MEDFPHKERTYRIIGACFEVYNEKGSGFLEAVYQECLEIELGLQGVPFTAKEILRLEYKGRALHQTFQPDLICYGNLLVELKAVSVLADEHRAQVLNYLHASGCDVGLLMNFGAHPRLEFERMIRSAEKTRGVARR